MIIGAMAHDTELMRARRELLRVQAVPYDPVAVKAPFLRRLMRVADNFDLAQCLYQPQAFVFDDLEMFYGFWVCGKLANEGRGAVTDRDRWDIEVLQKPLK